MPSRQDIFGQACRDGCKAPCEDDGADLEVMAVSWYGTDEKPVDDDEADEEDEEVDAKGRPKARTYVPREYVIKAFGVTREGASVSMTVKNYRPHFFVRVEQAWGQTGASRLAKFLRGCRGSGWEVVDAEVMRGKDFWGFQNGETHEFVRVTFRQWYAMKQLAKRLVTGTAPDRPQPAWVKEPLAPQVCPFGPVKLYESNIDPLLRFMHKRSLSPAGWLRVRGGRWSENTWGETLCQLDVTCEWTDVDALERDEIAPLLVMSFDIECGSSHGDFPVAKKDLRKLGMELVEVHKHSGVRACRQDTQLRVMSECLSKAFGMPLAGCDGGKGDVLVKALLATSVMHPKAETLRRWEGGGKCMEEVAGAVLNAIREAAVAKGGDSAIERVTKCLGRFFPPPDVKRARPGMGAEGAWKCGATPDPPGQLEGDPVIQIGVTMHVYGDKRCCARHVFTLGTCEAFEGTTVHECMDEKNLLLDFAELVRTVDPDIVTGYNIFGFDCAYLNGRAEELGVAEAFKQLGRLRGVSCDYRKQSLSSSALGDNELRYFDMHGRTQVDLMKVVMRDHKLDSYKLDAVAEHFMGLNKHDVSPSDIFRMQKGSASDRRVIAEYCVQDSALCNHLLMRLETIANNVAMANVCSVPLSYIFLRGQGVKIFSLVAKRCMRDGFLIPALAGYTATATATGTAEQDGWQGQQQQQEEEGYEGAIVLEPETGLYFEEPVSVLDYASLYPSSMISENLSHDTLVLDPKYGDIPGVEYTHITYDVHDDKGRVVRQDVCSFAQEAPGILPMILRDLLSARKEARAKIKALDTRRMTDTEEDAEELEARAFLRAVLEGQQVAFKVTANSLYGQMGARTSPLYLKHVAACTTATGRAMIMKAKRFLEEEHGARIVYGDTDSVFAVFPNMDPLTGKKLTGVAALQRSIDEGIRASKEFRRLLKAPHDLEYEKTYFPLILLKKKGYVGRKFERDTDYDKSEVSSMGLVTKRRDNAPIVKTIYGGIIDILLDRQNVPEAEAFLKGKLLDLVEGRVPLEDLIVTKALKGFYKAPDTIAHYVLARRMGERDPGNKPQANDRIPYVYIVAPTSLLQGERIEDPAFVRDNDVQLDTTHYVTNQIMKPLLQLFALAPERLTGFDGAMKRGLREVVRVGGNAASYKEAAVRKLLFAPILAHPRVIALEKARIRIGEKRKNDLNHQRELTYFFHVRQQSVGGEGAGAGAGAGEVG